MRSVRHLLMMMPILLIPATLAVPRAEAAGAAAEEAVRILASAKAANARCKILSGGDSADLSRILARAELAAASQLSPAAAQVAARDGATQGSSGACTAAVNKDVRETLAAARDAIAIADGQSRRTAQKANDRPKRKIDSVEKPLNDRPAAEGARDSADTYGRLVKAYYVERKCRHLDKSQADRFWRAIVRIHKRAVQTNGAARIAPIMRRAESAARGMSCGGSSMAMVKAGLAESRGR